MEIYIDLSYTIGELRSGSSIQDDEHSEKTDDQETKDQHHHRGVADQGRVDVSKPTVLANFTTGTNGFHLDDVLAHAARAMADFFHEPNPIIPRIIVLFISIG